VQARYFNMALENTRADKGANSIKALLANLHTAGDVDELDV
jgi:hypothetical protein